MPTAPNPHGSGSDDNSPHNAGPHNGSPNAGSQNGGGRNANSTPPAPADHLVTTRHTLATPVGEFAYTATTGRVVLREEVHTDGAFDGHQARAELFVTAAFQRRAP
ncbi:hypothetical protein [Actinopolymorpha alba]|uniref:hypothetical protein n=1 Tax=Actinopolymorpha alba TaxID=533267 RepID=UPI0003A566E3|nr:hypothetical protein [Actinopolymorpha alba]